MSTKDTKKILKISNIDDYVVDFNSDAARLNRGNPRPDNISMVPSLNSESHTKSDNRRGGRKGKRVFVKFDLLAYTDGYHGRGSFRKLPILPEPINPPESIGSSSISNLLSSSAII